MKVAIIYNKDLSGVINVFGIQNKEVYNPETVKAIANALESGGHNVEMIDGNMHVIERLQDFMPKVMEGEKMGMVFNMAYGIQGESRYTHIPSMLEMLGIPYVGSSPAGHALALDKVITKIILQKHGISTPDFWVFSSAEDDMSKVVYPAIVKPKMEAVSFGLGIVHNEKDLKKSVQSVIDEFQQQALVEQFIRGREFAVGLLGNNPVEAFPILEFDLENDPDAVQSVDDKRIQPRNKVCPAQLTPELTADMQNQSIAAFRALQLRDFSRADIRMDENNNIYILEINSMASLGPTSSYVHAAKVVGYNYKALVNKMLDVAAVRYFAIRSGEEEVQLPQKKIPFHIRIRGFLRSRQDTFENLLQRIVNINTYVRNVEGVNELGNLIKKELSYLGFTHKVIPQVEVGNLLFFTNSSDNKYHILLLGSLDNRTRISEHEYFRIREQKLYGAGIWSHKGGITALLAALQALKFIRLLKKIRIAILLTTDSSLQGKFSKPHVISKSIPAQYIMSLHGGDVSGSLITSRSGAAAYRCNMHLQQADESNKVSIASSVFSRLVNSWCELSLDDNRLIIAPYKMEIHTDIMQLYAHGEALLSVRFNDLSDFDTVDKKIRNLIPRRKHKDYLHFQVEGGLSRPPMIETDATVEMWKRIKKIASKLDIQLTKEHRWSSSDICFINDGKPMLDGFGPVGGREQERSEFILRHSLLERASLLAMTLCELTNE